MNAKKILFITGSMVPFVPEDSHSRRGCHLPQSIQEAGHEIRTFTPKWGNINERRNQLHEVIRLSGMNIIIDETDHPLIIKVASLPSARMQIYFIDNDDYFMKRGMAVDDNGKEYDDNGERAIFYARGVLETVKKLCWVPDVIHCHGWITALAPLYIKKAYMDEPSFAHTKVVFSAAAKELSKPFGPTTINSIPFKSITVEDNQDVTDGVFDYDGLQKLAIKYSDGVVLDDDHVSPDVIQYAQSLGLPVLENQPEDDYTKAYSDFYESIVTKE